MEGAIQKTVLPNGLRILSKKIPHVRSISMGLWVNVGARDESLQENGLSHFIEHMMFKGTKSRSAYQIAKEFDAIGGHTNAFTSAEYTCYHARVLDSHLDTMVDILSDILLNSEFSPQEIENERPVILSEISMLEDSPEEHIHALLEENYWKDHPLGRSILGVPENIQSFTSESISAYFRSHYNPERIIISVAGNVEHDRLLNLLTPMFGAMKSEGIDINRTVPEINTHTRIYKKNLEQVHVCLGCKGISLIHPARFACSLINTILGGNMSSRLFQEIREKRGLAYSIYSFSSLNIDSGMFGIYTGVSADNVLTSLSLILNELDRLCQSPITESELQDAKEYAKGNILLSSESTDNQMVRLAQNEIHFGRNIPLEETLTNISDVTSEDLLNLSRDMFKSVRPSLTILGPLPVNRRGKIENLLEGFFS